MINKPLNNIEESDFQNLVTNQIPEGKSFEYKEELPGNSDSDKKEFLYDITSLANASGGDLIFGIKEANGIADEVKGLSISSADSEILRLENIILTGVEPRIPGISTKEIQMAGKGPVIIMRIPKSWAMPHMVKLGGISKFYSRNSKGKYQLDVGEIRSAFALSETATERIRNFRIERTARIIAGEDRIKLDNNSPRLILHIVPLTASDLGVKFDVASLAQSNLGKLSPIGDNMNNYRHNFDGLLTSAGSAEGCYSYLQIFRNGSIEAVRSSYYRSDSSTRIIPSKFEDDLLKAIKRFLSIQEILGVDPPLFIMLSLMGATGYIVGADNSSGFGNHPIDRDALLVPEVELDNYQSNIDQIMKPIFDSVWNASGWVRSINYDENGTRIIS